MTEKIDPDLFARLMGLSKSARNDLLEFLGETPVAEAELQRLIDDVANSDEPPDPPEKPS